VFGPRRSRQEQSDRREPVPAEHENLTPEERLSRPVGSAARFGGHHLARLHIIPRLLEFLALHPDLEMEVILDDRVIDLVEEGTRRLAAHGRDRRLHDGPPASWRRPTFGGDDACLSPAGL
jgi:DNA-binding transcriptional LysR family regulator